jgi:hypothetical protein
VRTPTNINDYSEQRIRTSLAARIPEVAYMMGHGRIGPPPSDEDVDVTVAFADMLLPYLNDAADGDEPLDVLDLLDALATAGLELKPVAMNKTNHPAWAYHMTLAEG